MAAVYLMLQIFRSIFHFFFMKKKRRNTTFVASSGSQPKNPIITFDDVIRIIALRLHDTNKDS